MTHAWKVRARYPRLLGRSQDKDPAWAAQSSYKGSVAGGRQRVNRGTGGGGGAEGEDTPNPVPRHFSLL